MKKNYKKAAKNIQTAVKLLKEAHDILGYTVDIMVGDYLPNIWIHPIESICYMANPENESFDYENWIKECEAGAPIKAMKEAEDNE